MSSRPMRRAALILLLLVVTLVASELAVRGVELATGQDYALDLTARLDFAELLFQPHPYVGYVMRPGATAREGSVMPYSINSLGYRGPEFSARKPPGELRIAALGGSTVFGVGSTGDEQTWPAQLERELRTRLAGRAQGEGGQRGPWTDVRVINAGVSGYTLMESFVELKMRLLACEPDLIIVYHGVNDARVIDRGNFKPDYTNVRGPWSIPVPTASDVLLGWSHLYGVLSGRGGERLDLYDLVYKRDFDTGPKSEEWELGVDNYESTLRQTVAVARVTGAEVVLASLAYTRERPVKAKWMSDEIFTLMDRLNAAAQRVATEQKTLFVDLQPALGGERELFVDPIHLSDAGNARIARALAQELVRAGVLDQPLPPRPVLPAPKR